MNRRKEISDELNVTAPTLAGIENQLPYSVPAEYFETLPAVVMSRIKTANVTSAEEELALISPLLSGLSREMPYSAPEGYFESLEPVSASRIEEVKAPARVVKMFQPQRGFRVAAAAALAGLIGVAGWLLMKEPAHDNYAVKSDTEVQKVLEPKVNQISDTELANFVEGGALITAFYNTTPEEISEEDIKLMLADIPDQELEKYLDHNTPKEKFN